MTIKVKKKVSTITIGGYNFMILSYFFSIERDCRETEDWPVLGFFDK